MCCFADARTDVVQSISLLYRRRHGHPARIQANARAVSRLVEEVVTVAGQHRRGRLGTQFRELLLLGSINGALSLLDTLEESTSLSSTRLGGSDGGSISDWIKQGGVPLGGGVILGEVATL